MSVEARDAVRVGEVGPEFNMNKNLALGAYLKELLMTEHIRFQIVGGVLDMLYLPGTDVEKQQQVNTKVMELLHPVATAV